MKSRFNKAKLRFMEDTFERFPRPNVHQKEHISDGAGNASQVGGGLAPGS